LTRKAVTKNPKDRTAVASFSDHEVITPPNPLMRAVTRAALDDDPVARAEAALVQLSSEFAGWMHDDCERLDQARARVHQSGMNGYPIQALFRAAHDIKGQAATLGFPQVAAVAESLCRLIEHARDPLRIPPALIDQHVDAVRAIIRERDRPRVEKIAEILSRSLREVTEDFLRREGKELDEVEGVPPIAPEK
jgi:HPt (histidine-containing phosphotransfer) domain-containing protein